MLSACGVDKAYIAGRAVLRGVNLALNRAETLGLVGESGCGKSTLAGVLCRLLACDGGSLLIDGAPYGHLRGAALRAFRRRVQPVFQDGGALDPKQTVYSALAEPLVNFFRVPRAQRRRRVEGLLADVGLEPDCACRYPHQLSGGQRQRVLIARALAAGPDYLICDEPVASLDAQAQAAVLGLLRRLCAERGLGCLFITHDLALAESVCERIAVMRCGAIVEVFAVGRRPSHEYSRALFDSRGPRGAAQAPA